MTSRERIQAVLDGRKPDRVPIDFCGTRTSGISAFLYQDLRDCLGLEKQKTRVIDVYQMLALPDADIIKRLHSDVILAPRYSYKLNTTLSGWKPYTFHGREKFLVPANFSPEVNAAGDMVINEGETVQAKMPAGGYYFDYLEKTYSTERVDIDSVRFETWSDEDFLFCEKSARALYEGTDKALVGDFAMSLGRPSSFEAWMLDLGMNPSYLKEYYDKKSDHIVNMLKKYKEAVNPFISIIYFGQDFGTQLGEMISPDMFKEPVDLSPI
jgi:uroporphyrinogen decarboxylase